MQPLEFGELAELLNHSRHVTLDSKPILESHGNWTLYRGEYRVHMSRAPFEVLYLSSKATSEAVRDARSRAFKPGQTQVVYPRSLDQRQKAHHELLRKDAKGFWTIRQYLYSFLSDDLKAYSNQIRGKKPRYYVQPRVRVPAGARHKDPNPLMLVLRDQPYNPEDRGRLAVLLADAGQGKTYMCDFLSSELITRKEEVIPIYISAEQWHGMDLDDLASFSKTVIRSFRHFGHPISWAEGYEEQFLRVSLKAGLFKIVFDGFDEYVLRNQGRVTAQEALANIVSLTELTGTDIVITSRTWFWESEFGADTRDDDPFDRYYLEPFDRQEAKQYFENRFQSETRRKQRAIEIFTSLLSDVGQPFAGRGFVLGLVADLVADDSHTPPIADGSIGWVLHGLCEREERRQALPINADQQLDTLTQFAIDTASGDPESEATIDFALHVCAETLDERTRKDCLRKMSAHPLIREMSGEIESRWEFTQPQVRILLLARYLISSAQDQKRKGALQRFSRAATLSEGDESDLSMMLIDLVCTQSVDANRAIVTDLVEKFLAFEARPDDVAVNTRLSRLASLMAVRAVDRCIKSPSHAERTATWLEILGRRNRRVDRFILLGTLSRFDFRNLELIKCRLDKLSWANCEFDETTRFIDCHVEGGSVNYCRGFGSTTWINETTDRTAAALISSAQIEAGRRRYSEEDLRADVRVLLDKFLTKSGGLKTVAERHLVSGTIGRSKHRDDILEELKKKLLRPHHISGFSDKGYAVTDEAIDAFRFYQVNNVFVGPIKEAFERLRKKVLGSL